MNSTDEQWKEAAKALDAVGREVQALNDRINANRKKWQQDRIAEMKTELRTYETNPSRHDD
jgi:hypothetical protein